MFGWLRNLAKRTTIVDDDRLVLSAPALPEHPLAAPAEHDDESRPLHHDAAAGSPIRAAAAAAAARAQQPAGLAAHADFALPAESAEAPHPAAPAERAPASPIDETPVEAPTRPVHEHVAAHAAAPAAPVATAPAAPAAPVAPGAPAAPAPAASEPAAPAPAASEPAAPEAAAEPETPAEPAHPTFDGIVPAPSQRPAMPLSAHPNFAGLDLAVWEPSAPRLLEPEAALTPAAQQELLKLFDDLFGPAGRYRLEWRADRRVGDDAFFAEIMTADLVRRVQNTIADVAGLDRVEPPKRVVRRREITAGPSSVAPDALEREGGADLPKAS